MREENARLSIRQQRQADAPGRENDSLVGRFAEEHYDEVYRYCARRLPSKEDARDVTQEVFLRLVRSNALYAEHGKPLAYLYTCARNVCVDFYRGQRPVGALDEDDAQAIPDARACRHGRTGWSWAGALARLTEEEREVIELRYGQDLPMSDISAVTGEVEVRPLSNRAARARQAQGTDGRRPWMTRS